MSVPPGNGDVTVAIVSRDPFFLFAARGLLGRDRHVRIYASPGSLAELRAGEANEMRHLDAVVCDLDTTLSSPTFDAELQALLARPRAPRVLCLAEGRMPEAAHRLADCGIHALLGKDDLDYCLHLAIKAVVDYDATLLTPASLAALAPESGLRLRGLVIRPERAHPDLTDRIAEIVMWRIFIGLDNPDIQDELLLGGDTVRGYVYRAYRALGAANELEAFDALSEWWWTTRFSPLVQD